MSSGAHALWCDSNCGSVDTVISRHFNAGENNTGFQAGSSSVKVDNIKISMDKGTASEVFQYYGDYMPQNGSGAGDWSFRRVDDYISIALRIYDACYSGPVYAPFNIVGRIQNKNCIPFNYKHNTKATITQTFESRIRIDKRLVSGTYSKNILIGAYKMCQESGCILLKSVYLSLNIVVKESCEINAGQMIDVNFNTIPVNAFRYAGEKAVGVSPILRTLKVSCSNIDPNTNLSLRVQAGQYSGNAIVSNNPDVGFVISDLNDRELTPNDTSSILPFNIGNNNNADVPIKVYPVSVTGNKPKEGVVTSTAYLRVDFD